MFDIIQSRPLWVACLVFVNHAVLHELSHDVCPTVFVPSEHMTRYQITEKRKDVDFVREHPEINSTCGLGCLCEENQKERKTKRKSSVECWTPPTVPCVPETS